MKSRELPPQAPMVGVYNAKISGIPMPSRITFLPVSDSGFPTPWFVHLDKNGNSDFRVVGHGKLEAAVKHKLCWICGQPLGRTFALTMGTMCVVNRTVLEPPAHRECAVYSAIACPFLSNPRMRRNAVGLPDHVPAPGLGIKRNPGAVAVWVTRGYRPFKVGNGVLFTFDDPLEVLWFAEGREATRAEVMQSITSGLPILAEEAGKEGEMAMRALARQVLAIHPLLPPGPEQPPILALEGAA